MPPAPEPIPTHIGKYEILSVLGRGGMGIVYRAHDPGMRRDVALKTLTGDFPDIGSMLKRFYREAEKTGRLNHPNIITIYELGEHENHPYIVMEFLEGEPLDSIIQSGRSMPLVYKLNILEQICSALAHAHSHDVIHRDVKPANVMIQPDGTAKLLDFGIAAQEKTRVDTTLTQVGSIIGTVPYMSPERLSGASFDGRSDVFAVGILMFQMLTGHLPFHGEDHEIAYKIMYERQPSLQTFVPDCPPELDEIVGRALEKDPARRYATAEEMAVDLYSVLQLAKEQHVNETMLKAKELSSGPDLTAARETVLEVLRWNAKHTRARSMLAEINQRLSQRQQTEVAEQKRRLAESALVEKKYDTALDLFEEALRLTPEDTALAAQVEEVKTKKLLASKVMELCSEAEKARRKGDFSSSLTKLETAMKLDGHDSRIRHAYNQLLEQARQAEARAKAKSLLLEASQSLQRRDFRAALALADQAETLDPSNPDIHQLIGKARNGLRDDERRAMLGEIEMRVASVTSEDDLREVSRRINEALERLPSDPSLLRLRLELDLQLRSHKDRRTVEEATQTCRQLLDSDPLAARACVQKALTEVPGDARLLTLAERIDQRLKEQTQQSQRQASLLQAKEALDRKDFEDAIKVLSRCQGDCYSEEVAELLHTAQGLWTREQRLQDVSRCHLAAQEEMRAENYEAVCALIEPVLDQGPDEALEQMLHKARAAHQERTAERESALLQVRTLSSRGLHEQAVAAIAALPSRIAALPELTALLQQETSALAAQREQMEELGRAYLNLTTQDPASDWRRSPAVAEQESRWPIEARMWRSLSARREDIANQALRAHCTLLQSNPAAGEKALTRESLSRLQAFAGFAGKEVAREWLALAARLLPKDRPFGLSRIAKLRKSV